MKKLFFVLFIALALVILLNKTPTARAQLAPINLTCRYFGPAVVNGTTYYYFIQGIYANGRSSIVGPCSVTLPATLGPPSSSYVQVTWTPTAQGQYDVMKSTSSTTPTGTCNCAIAVNLDNPSLTDSGLPTLAYTVTAGGGGGGSGPFPQTVSGTINATGIPYFSSPTQMSSSGALGSGDFILGGNPPTDAGFGVLALPFLNPGGGVNNYTSGIINNFRANATNPGLVTPCFVTLPSTPLTGEYGCDTNGNYYGFDGVNIRYFPFVPGSGNASPSNMGTNALAYWVGGGFAQNNATNAKILSGDLSDNTLRDSNGNLWASITPTASAVDGVCMLNAAAGNPAVVTFGTNCTGNSDANINFDITSKGNNNSIRMRPGSEASPFFLFQDVAGVLARFQVDDSSGSYIFDSSNFWALSGLAGSPGNALVNGINTGIGWTNGNAVGGTTDTGLSRGAAGKLAVGTGTIGNATATLQFGNWESRGTVPTVSGCGTISSQVGGASAGSFLAGATTCNFTLTFAYTAPNGWTCAVWDFTTPADVVKQTNYTTTTAVFTATVVSSDKITYGCQSF